MRDAHYFGGVEWILRIGGGVIARVQVSAESGGSMLIDIFSPGTSFFRP